MRPLSSSSVCVSSSSLILARICRELASFHERAKFTPSTLCRTNRLLPILALLSVVVLCVPPANATPKITVMTPQSGPVGTSVVIIGSGFGTTQGSSTVTFNGTPVTWASWGSSSLEVQVPVGATSGNVMVKVGGVSSNSKSFTVTLVEHDHLGSAVA